MVGGGQNETTATDGVGNNQPQDSGAVRIPSQDEETLGLDPTTSQLQVPCRESESRSVDGRMQIPSQNGGTGLGLEPATSQLQTPRQGEATQTSSLSDVSGAHNTVIHAGPGSNIYLGHPASVERTGYDIENITDDPSQPPVEYSTETEQTLTTFDTELDLRQTEKPAIAGPEPDPNTDPWVRWTPEGNNLHIRLPKEFCSPSIQSSVSPRCQGNEDTPCSRCPEKEAQIKTLRDRDWHLDREIASLKEKLQKATSYSDKMVEERNSYISKYNQLHDSQIEIYTELARVKEERDRYITESHRMKEEIEKFESVRSKGKDVSAFKSFEARRKISELEEQLKMSKDDTKFWREKSEGQSRDLVKAKAHHEKIVKGLQKEVNDLQGKVERYQQQVQHLEEQLEKNSDSKLMREKVQVRYMRTYIQSLTRKHTQTHTQPYMHSHTQSCTYTHTRTWHKHAHTCSHIPRHTHTHTQTDRFVHVYTTPRTQHTRTCELDLQRSRDDLFRAEAEIKRKETDLNGKGRALSRLERKLQLTEHEKTAADNKINCATVKTARACLGPDLPCVDAVAVYHPLHCCPTWTCPNGEK
ncbi:uncharacterized protein LOC144915141 [Branchiostoma floridae x Branchiostoma belcheri]